EVLIQQLLEPLLLAVGQKRARVVVPNNGPNGSAKGPQALAQRGRIVGIQEQVAAEQRMQLKTPHAVPLAQKLRPGNEASGQNGGIYQLEAGASSRLFGTGTRKGDTASRTRASLKRPPPRLALCCCGRIAVMVSATSSLSRTERNAAATDDCHSQRNRRF